MCINVFKSVVACVSIRCMIRVLDSFGTEPDFNHPAWAQQHNLTSYFGGLNLTPMQFNTMFRMFSVPCSAPHFQHIVN